MKSFYETLESIAAEPLDVQILKLKDFINHFPKFERAYVWLHERYILTDRIEEAKAFFEDLAAKKPHERNSHWMLAKSYILEKNPDFALQAFTEALRAGPSSPELIIDFLLFDNKNFRKFNDPKYLAKIALPPEQKQVADALFSYLKLDFREAIQRFSQLPKRVSNQLPILYSWGNCHSRLAEQTKADSLWQFGLTRAHERMDKEFQAKFLMNLGILPLNYRTLNGLSYFDSSYVIASRIGDLPRLEYLAGNRGIIYREQGDYSLSENLFQQAINTSIKLRSNWKLARWYAHYGQLLHYMNRFDDALKYYDMAAESAKKSNYKQKIVQSMLGKGHVYRSIGHNQLARQSYSKAYVLARSKNLIELMMYARIGQADNYFEEGNYDKARVIYKKYLNSAIYKKGYLTDRSYWFLRSGRTYRIEKNYKMAQKDFQQAFTLAQRAQFDTNMIWSLVYLAEIDFIANKLSKATQKYQSGLEIATANQDSSTLPVIYLGLGQVHQRLREFEKAISQFNKAAVIIELTRHRLKNPQIRVEYFVDGSEVYNKLIECYYQLYLEKNNPVHLDSLYYFVEMSRGRSLRDLKRQKINISHNEDNQQASAYQKVCKELQRKQRFLRDQGSKKANESELDKAMAEMDIARSSLIAERLRLAMNTSDSKRIRVPALSILMNTLKKQENGLLLYHISENAAFVIAVAHNEVRLVPLDITVATLNSAIDKLISPFHLLNERFIQEIPFRAQIAFKLYQKIIKPVEDSINLPQNLLIIPDTEFMNLPFEMLLIKAPDKPEYRPQDAPSYAKHFLQHKYTIVYSPTTNLLEKTSRWSFTKPDIVVFANPFDEHEPTLLTVNNGGISSLHNLPAQAAKSNSRTRSSMRQFHLRTGWWPAPLPFSELEANKIKELYSSAKVYKRSSATKFAFLDEVEKNDIIHVASHGFIDSTYDAFSGLLLAVTHDSTDDGLLMGYEISDLNLNCDLVSLSACETARGRLVAGEGVLGLPRLFLSAGAKSVLMTLWKVDDLFASQLMPEFYQQYLNNNLSKSEALAMAKRIMLNKKTKGQDFYYQHPLFWASFTLFGDPGQSRIVLLSIKNLFLLAALILIVFLMLMALKKYKVKANQP